MSACKACLQPLILELDPDDFNEATSSSAGGPSGSVPDDLLLPCGCHFHWQCLLDESPRVTMALTCPACGSPLTSTISGPSATSFIGRNEPQHLQILTRYVNEGGTQEGLDILPLITEEAYLCANPSARPARAYMTMCAEGDITGIVELLHTVQDDEEDEDEQTMSAGELLRYQDPLEGMMSALHVALMKGQEEVIWLLLWLASDLPLRVFPAEAIRVARSIGAARDLVEHGVDIRTLKNQRGQNPRLLAESMGSNWATLLNNGVFDE